jgi:hypothetical protein
MSVIVRFIIGFAFAGISIVFFNASGKYPGIEQHVPTNVVAIVAAIGAGVFILLGVLEIAKKSDRNPSQVSTADELRKLADLRSSGAISEKEFELQKVKLL